MMWTDFTNIRLINALILINRHGKMWQNTLALWKCTHLFQNSCIYKNMKIWKNFIHSNDTVHLPITYISIISGNTFYMGFVNDSHVHLYTNGQLAEMLSLCSITILKVLPMLAHNNVLACFGNIASFCNMANYAENTNLLIFIQQLQPRYNGKSHWNLCKID